MQNQLLEFIRNNKVKSVLDIGANCGSFSWIIKSHFPYINIMMLEANPFCEKHLNKTNIPYKIVCLSDSEKEVDFFIEDNNLVGTGASYYLEKTHWYSQKKSQKLKTKMLDDIITESYDFIKLDTQGSELDIMRGGKKVINSAKFLLIETTLIEYNENAPLKQEIFDYLKPLGFSPSEIVEKHYYGGNLIQEDWIFTR